MASAAFCAASGSPSSIIFSVSSGRTSRMSYPNWRLASSKKFSILIFKFPSMARARSSWWYAPEKAFSKARTTSSGIFANISGSITRFIEPRTVPFFQNLFHPCKYPVVNALLDARASIFNALVPISALPKLTSLKKSEALSRKFLSPLNALNIFCSEGVSSTPELIASSAIAMAWDKRFGSIFITSSHNLCISSTPTPSPKVRLHKPRANMVNSLFTKLRMA